MDVFVEFLSEFQPRLYVVGKRGRAILPKYYNKTFYYFAALGFGIAEYNDWPIIEKKKKKKKKIGSGGSIPENGRKSPKMKSIVPDLSDKIMACMPLLNIHFSRKKKQETFVKGLIIFCTIVYVSRDIYGKQ